MKRASRRRSRRASRSSRPSRTSRRLTPNASVERQLFGQPIDPDRVSGKAGDALDGAIKRYETFQQKAPRAVVRVTHDVPANVYAVGDALSVMYRSSKWTKDGEEEVDVDYKHLHEPSENKEYAVSKGVRLYENARYASSGVRKNGAAEKIPCPESWARLGYCLGVFVRRDDDGETYEINPRKTWLLSSPDGHLLAIYSPKPQPNGDVGFLCLLKGGKLRVLKEGIDG